jgi:hypothetical protein
MQELTRAQESRAAIEKIYIEMRHLFNRGFYKPFGVSGREVNEALVALRPEIYGSIGDSKKVELDGLVYVIDRLPRGIEECRYVRFITEEGYQASGFVPVIPPKRVRNCYRVDRSLMLMEITRGRSEIYDSLTHLTFLYNEAEKIRSRAVDDKTRKNFSREWTKLEEIIRGEETIDEHNKDIAFTYLSTLLGRTFAETKQAYDRLAQNPASNNGLFHVVYWLGKIAIDEFVEGKDREISFSPALRDRIGHHIYGERWANSIKNLLAEEGLLGRPLHIISANPHSVLNCLFAYPALRDSLGELSLEEYALELSKPEKVALRREVEQYGEFHGMYYLYENSGANIPVQVFDTDKLPWNTLHPALHCDRERLQREKPLILVMDYAFGEQAYETLDELLKPHRTDTAETRLNVVSISIMGKAGILEGEKGDLMIPTAHVFEGTADNYPFVNDFSPADFADCGLRVFEGAMITVLGTSLQNRDVLSYFKHASWGAVGLEMEGAHYQKAIQAASQVRRHIRQDVVLRYAYYASDNPLVTGATLASGSLGMVGVKPTYLITEKILNRILG